MCKRRWLLGVALCCTLSLVGCGKGPDSSENIRQEDSNPDSEQAAEENAKKDKARLEVVYNNGGNFVKVGEDIFYIKVTENAFPQNALFAEYRAQIRAGEECALMRYSSDGEAHEVASVLGHSPIAYYDSCFYVCGRGEDYREQIWEVEKESGEKKLVADAKMMDIDPQTGRYVAYHEQGNQRVLTVYAGADEVCAVSLPMEEDSLIDNAYIRGDYLIYWEMENLSVEGDDDWGDIYAYHIPSKTTRELGEIPFSRNWGDAYYPEIEQLVVQDKQVFFTIGYYGGTGHFLEESSVFQGDLENEDSVTYLRSEELDEDYIYYGEFHESSLPDIVITNLQDHEIYLDYDKYALCYAKPVAGKLPETVELLAREQFENGNPDYQIIELAEYVDGKAYCIIDHVVENPEESVGWRTAYTAKQVEFCAIDVESREYTLLESQIFAETEMEIDVDNSDYLPFLKGEYWAVTSYIFEEDDELYNEDGLYSGRYTIDELIDALPVLETEEIVVSYAFHDFNRDNQEEMVLRLENTEPGLLRWTGIFSFDYDCPLYLETAFVDGYRSNAKLYDNGYLVHSGSNGAAAYETSVHYLTEGYRIEECFSLKEMYGYSVAELMYDLVDPYSVELSYDYEVDEQFAVRAYVVPGFVEFSVDSRSDNSACAEGEERVLDGLRDAGAVEVGSDGMDELFNLSDYYTEEIKLTEYGVKYKN